MDVIVERLTKALRAASAPVPEKGVHVPRRLRPRHARATFIPVSDRLLARWLAS